MTRCRIARRPMRLIGLLVTGVLASRCGTAATQTPAPAASSASSSTASLAGAPGAELPSFVSADLYRLQSVGDVQISPDGTRVAYTVQLADRPGRPYSQLWVVDVASGRLTRIGTKEGSTPRWSPDGQRLAYVGETPDGASGLIVSRADGGEPFLLAPLSGTNAPLPSTGDRFDWSPDGKQIAFVSSTPGPEGNPDGDPIVITRYNYKPPASYPSRWNDNRRLHIFVADVSSKQIRQLTDGTFNEHSIGWSPKGDRLAFISNRESDPDRVFNYDLFTIEPATRKIVQLTKTKSAEYRPTWSPDGRTLAYQGTKRTLTSSETTMEDTHVWLVDADTTERKDLGATVDNRQGAPQWSPDGREVFFTIQRHGQSMLFKAAASSGRAAAALPSMDGVASVGSWSLSANGVTALALSTPGAPADLFVQRATGGPQRLTTVNKDLLARKAVAPVDAFMFKSFDGLEVEAFLTKPAQLDPASATTHPLIVMIHGGPHGQQGAIFNHKAQVYAARGYATLMVNYRGSTGYGQKFADAIFKDQNGGEAKDVLAGVDAAIAKYPWIDRERLGVEGGSYGGQLTNWLITQTPRFKAAVPSASISNLVTQNYMSYYHDYLAVEFGAYPHTDQKIMDLLWQRSAIRYVANVKTPVLFIHGDNDNNVNIAEAEQFFIALKDAGVETVMLRYPREGHGLRESTHIVDSIDRSIDWYERHFKGAGQGTR
jgi:dipeptidyl aminopeptidase/acylaminoacyl peptidase